MIGLRKTPYRWMLTMLVVVALVPLTPSSAEIAGSRSRRVPMGYLTGGAGHTCAILDNGRVRCWGNASEGKIGYGNLDNIGDNEIPSSVGTVQLGAGRTAVAIDAGDSQTCAILDNGRLKCWGSGNYGRLGYGNLDNIGDNETPAAVGTVQFGAGRTVKAVSAGYYHTCALLDNGKVHCFGDADAGALGGGNQEDIGDNETPGSVPGVNLGAGRKAVAISSSNSEHSCAVLDNGRVRCWGEGGSGQLGYGNTNDIGDNESPASVGPVDLGAGRTARAISNGFSHTCVILDNGGVRCWGTNSSGQLGYGNVDPIGDNETPGSFGPVQLGAGRTAKAISAGDRHTCVILDNNRVRCWGYNAHGQLGYGNVDNIGDNESPASVGFVNLGTGRTARAISSGWGHTCALLDNGRVRCWGDGSYGALGLGNTDAIGDNEAVTSVGPVQIGREVATRGSTRLTLIRRPRRDGSAPYRYRVRGTLRGMFVPDRVTCVGSVRILAKREGRTVGSARAPLSVGDRGCRYRKSIRVTGAGALRIVATYGPTSNLRASRSPAVRAVAG